MLILQSYLETYDSNYDRLIRYPSPPNPIIYSSFRSYFTIIKRL
uniref:Uncharacterized protein n=1 Tax=Lepeophtheirus salmonis TaxID=72036 RepID=A0A0K2U420_LEPSM